MRLKKNKTLQVETTEVLTPDHRCIAFEAYANDETCWPLWWDHWDYCDEYWTEECEAVDDAFYGQDIDWVDPDPVDPDCLVYWDNWDDSGYCDDQFWTALDQCYHEDEFWGRKTMWTDQCEMLYLLDEAWSILEWTQCVDENGEEQCEEWWAESDDEDWCEEGECDSSPAVLHRRIKKSMARNPTKYTQAVTSLMQKPAVEATAIEGGFDTGAAATGFGAGFVGVFAVAGLAKMFRRN